MEQGHAGIVATGTIVVLGVVVMIVPLFGPHQRIDGWGMVMPSSDIFFTGDEMAPSWSILSAHLIL